MILSLGRIACILSLLLCLFGCYSSPSTPTSIVDVEINGPVWFEDVTDAVGLDFVNDPGPTGDYFMPQTVGSGCAFLHDGDGTIYLYLLQNAGPGSKSVNRLYKRLPDGKLQDVTAGSGLGVAGYNMGVAIADVNNDGLPDVLLTQFGGIRLFLNQGGGHFEDVTEESGLNSLLWSTSAAFFDYDRDGWLDLVVVNYVDYDKDKDCATVQGEKDYCHPKNFTGTSTKLFHNRGPGPGVDGKPARVRFADVSFDSGIGLLPGPGLGVVCADFDGDGWPDIFVANDGQPNRLWINQKDGKFSEEATSRGVAYTSMGKAYAGMGVAMGDVTNGGLLDLFVTHLGVETHTLWKQGPERGHFKDRTTEMGLTTGHWHGTGFGTLLADFNLDGSLDLAIVNGRVMRGGQGHNTGMGFWETYGDKNQLFVNNGSGKFSDVSLSNKAFCDRWNVARGLAVSDFNDDGAPDLLVTAIGGRARLFRNVAPNRGHWLKVQAFDPKLKRDAYGAEVRVRSGSHRWLRVVNPAQSFLSSSSPLALFGLGEVGHYDAVEVTWPDGSREEFEGGNADRSLVLRKGEGHSP